MRLRQNLSGLLPVCGPRGGVYLADPGGAGGVLPGRVLLDSEVKGGTVKKLLERTVLVLSPTAFLLVVAFAVSFVVVACQGGGGVVHVGPDPTPDRGFRAVSHISGDWDGQAFMETIPVTALVRAHGQLTVTVRAFPPPFLVIDGDVQTIVEPLPGKEAEAVDAVQTGSILIRRAGVVGALNPVGSRDAYVAAAVAAQDARAAAKAKGEVTPPPPPQETPPAGDGGPPK